MWMREAGIARTGHTRLPSAARGAQLPAFQGSLVWGNHLTVLTKRLQASAPRRLGASGTDGRCVAPGSSSTRRGRARRNRHGDLDAGRLDPEKDTRGHAAGSCPPNLDTTPGQINRGRTDALRQGTMRPRKPFPGRRPSTLVLAVLGR